MDSEKRTLPLLALVLSTILAVWVICTSENVNGFEPWQVLLAMLFTLTALVAPALAGAGVWFLWRALARRLRIDAESRRTPQIFPGVPIRNVLPWKPQRLAPISVKLPDFGQFLSFTLNILMFVMLIFQAPRTHTGISISMRLPNPATGWNSPRSETLGVYVDGRSQFYVNGEAVPQDRLRENLK